MADQVDLDLYDVAVVRVVGGRCVCDDYYTYRCLVLTMGLFATYS